MMTDYLSNLPVELIEKIFDDLPIIDTLGSLNLVNKRLHLISLGYRRFRIDFSYIKRKKQFDLVCDQLTSISSRIVSLSFSDCNDETIPSKIEFFFSRFQSINDTFYNLKSLYLSKVNRLMWKAVQHHVKSLMTLVSLSIDVAVMFFPNDSSEFVSYLLNDILFLSTSLKYVYMKANDINVPKLHFNFREEQISLIEHLMLLDIPIALEQLYPHVPALRTFDINLRLYPPAYPFRLYPSENLRRVSLNIYRLYFSTMEQLLRPMRNLTDLIIIAYNVYNDMSDGTAWERMLARIISFKFLFTFDKSTWTKEPIKLDSFQSLFWLEKKQWYVTYDRCSISGFSLLYSIPYLMNDYSWIDIKGPVDTKSTGSQVVSLNNIDHFILDEELSLDSNHLRRLVNLERIVISEYGGIIDKLLDNMLPYIDMSRITTLSIKKYHSNIDIDGFVRLVSITPNLRCLGASIVLLKCLFFSRWPNIRRLKILLHFTHGMITETSLTVNEVDVFYRSFTHLEYLSFYRTDRLNPYMLLNKKPTTISNIIIYHPVRTTSADFPDFGTCDWLEQNTSLRDFVYSCNQINTVSFWF